MSGTTIRTAFQCGMNAVLQGSRKYSSFVSKAPTLSFLHIIARTLNNVNVRRKLTKTKKSATPFGMTDLLEVPARFELANESFADSCLTTWPRYHMKLGTPSVPNLFGAGDEARTRYLHLGKVALYRMSYTRIWCLRSELNQRHGDFQSPALPTELQRQTQ